MNWKKILNYIIPFNQGNTKTQTGVAVVLLLLIAAFATQCAKAEESYVQMGLGSTVVRGTAPVIDLALVYPDAGPKDARIEVGATFIGGSTHQYQFQRNNFAIRAAVIDALGRLDVGIGVAYLQNTDTYNGSHLNFNLLLGYRGDNWGIRWSHFSNGGTVSPNKGRDMVYAYREF
jgi:hypothetical protein